MKTEWTITRDHLGGEEAAAGMVGPRDAAMTSEQIINHPDAKRFRLYDDDRNLCYEGYLVGDDREFAPLDDFGEPNAGCTGIQIMERGHWQWL